MPARLVVESTPTGADVYIDGQKRGNTPFRGEISAGAHALDVRSGAANRAQTITVKAGELFSHKVELSPAPPPPPRPATTASLEVRSDPAGARVTIGGIDRGQTPVVVTGLAPGRLRVQVSGPFSAITRRVTLVAGQQSVMVVSPPPTPDPATTVDPGAADSSSPAGEPVRNTPVAGRGWITVDSPIVLRLVRNGDYLGTSEDGRIPLPAGSHVIAFENESVNFREVRNVDVQSNRGTAIAMPMPQGALNINAVPWAEVMVDNQRVGETPVSQLALPIGPHEVVFRHPQFGERRVTVIVKVGTPGRTFVDFTK